MPNWSWTQVEIMKGNSGITIEKIRKEFTDEEMEVKTDKVGDLTEKEKEDWYDTNIKYLGTKWEFKLEDIEEDDDNIYFRTETAWSEPREFFEEMASRFAGAVIKTESEYEGEEWKHSKECEAQMENDDWSCINDYDYDKCMPNIFEETYHVGKGGE